jgi:hypothetical protein
VKAFVYQEHFPSNGEPRIEWHSPRTPGRAHGLWLFSMALPFKLRFVVQGGKHK